MPEPRALLLTIKDTESSGIQMETYFTLAARTHYVPEAQKEKDICSEARHAVEHPKFIQRRVSCRPREKLQTSSALQCLCNLDNAGYILARTPTLSTRRPNFASEFLAVFNPCSSLVYASLDASDVAQVVNKADIPFPSSSYAHVEHWIFGKNLSIQRLFDWQTSFRAFLRHFVQFKWFRLLHFYKQLTFAGIKGRVELSFFFCVSFQK